MESSARIHSGISKYALFCRANYSARAMATGDVNKRRDISNMDARELLVRFSLNIPKEGLTARQPTDFFRYLKKCKIDMGERNFFHLMQLGRDTGSISIADENIAPPAPPRLLTDEEEFLVVGYIEWKVGF